MTEQPEPFTAEQQTRAEALRTARAVLSKSVGFATSLDVSLTDVIDLAEYIVRGVHPLDRYAETPPPSYVAVDARTVEAAKLAAAAADERAGERDA